jgi:hypothetical protein
VKTIGIVSFSSLQKGSDGLGVRGWGLRGSDKEGVTSATVQASGASRAEVEGLFTVRGERPGLLSVRLSPWSARPGRASRTP